jgi:hypothetical protein
VRIALLDTEDRSQVRAFLDLPFHIYQNIPLWVPPLAMDGRRMLDRKRNPFYKHSAAAFFLALDNTRTVGRLAVLDNRHYNEFNHERTAFFYLFECEQNYEATDGLFCAAFDWARSRGLTKIIGPKGFTALDGLGLLVRGFEHRPAFGIPYNPDYYPALIEAAGFQPYAEIVSGHLNAHMVFPEKIHRASEMIQKRRGLHIPHFKSRRDLLRLVPKLQALYNHSLVGTTGNVPLTDEEAKAMASQLLWFADPRLIKIIMREDEPVGFLFAYPDISAAVQRVKGKLFPLGWLDCLRELRRTRWVNINGAGIIEEYRGLGGTAILFSEMHKSIVAGGFENADIVQIGMENDKMQRELHDLGIDFYKAHRLYQQNLE